MNEETFHTDCKHESICTRKGSGTYTSRPFPHELQFYLHRLNLSATLAILMVDIRARACDPIRLRWNDCEDRESHDSSTLRHIQPEVRQEHNLVSILITEGSKTTDGSNTSKTAKRQGH